MNFDDYRALEDHLLERAAAHFGLENAQTLRLTEPPSAELGDVSLACHPLAGRLERRPDQLAAEMATALASEPFVAAASELKGFCNVTFERGALLRATARSLVEQGERYGVARDAVHRQRWLIEYSGPNTNKPLHIGHLRNTLLGSALAKMVALHGHEVLRYNIVNDRGIHICKSMVAYQRFGAGATPQSTGEKGDHLVGRFYSLFASKAAEEFAAWTRRHGAAALAEYQVEHATSLDTATDLELRKRFLGAWQSAGKDPGFPPKKVKPQDYPAKMAENHLEPAFSDWRAEQQGAAAEIRHAESVKRFQKAIERRFEAELSDLHRASREMLRLWEEGDGEVRALWRTMNGWVLEGIESTYARLGVSFDHVDYESDVYLQGKEIVLGLLQRGLARRRDDGAIVFDMPSRSAKEPPQEKVLLRSDGTSVYITQDLGSLLRRQDRHHPDRLVWVVGSEQELHFETLFALVDLHTPGLGARCEHLSYGMVELPHGKMKSREGEIVEADEFLDDVRRAAEHQVRSRSENLAEQEVLHRASVLSLAAVKYHLLKFSKRSTVKFDVDEALDLQGKSGAYCLYACARIRSIFRKLEGSSLPVPPLDWVPENAVDLAQEEIALLLLVGRFPDAVALAVRDLEPFHVADHVYKLARAFNAYYTATDESGGIRFPLVSCEDVPVRNQRIALVRSVLRTLENGLASLGIDTLDAM